MARFHFKFYPLFGLTQILFTSIPMPLVLWVFGGIFGFQWFQGRWRAHQRLGKPGLSISWQELFALVVAYHLWGSLFQNKRILLFCDNKPVVEIVNSKRSRIRRLMDLVRHLTLLTLRYNFYLKVQHIEGKRNDIADSLSRFQMEKFRHLAPHADPAPCQVLRCYGRSRC